MQFSKYEIDTIKYLSQRAYYEKLEFECMIKHPRPNRENCQRLINYCCSKYVHINEQYQTLDVFVNDLRMTIIDEVNIEKYLSHQEIPSNSWFVIKKTKERSIFNKDYGCKIILSKEKKLKNNIIDITNTQKGYYFRHKTRTSFRVKMYQIDITRVKSSNNEIFYEIEIEYVPFMEFNFQLWCETLNTIICIIRDCISISKFSYLEQVGSYFMEILSKKKDLKLYEKTRFKLSPKVVSLTTKRYYQMLDILKEYRVTPKTDGLRMTGFIHNTGELFLMEEKHNYFKSTGCFFSKDYEGTIFDGEFLNKNKSGENISHFLIFDCYFFCKEDVRKRHFDMRLTILEELIQEKNFSYCARPGSFEVSVKKFYSFNNNNFQFICKQCFEDIKKNEYANDGLIFTPNDFVGGNYLYIDYIDKPRYFVQSGFQFQKLLKWKDPLFNTIDFKIQIEDNAHEFSTQTMCGLVMKKQKICRLLVLYIDSNTRKAVMQAFDESGFVKLPLINGELQCWNGDIIHDGNIVEMSFAEEKWKPMRVRHDKKNPNHYKTAIDIWNSYKEPVTYDMLTEI